MKRVQINLSLLLCILPLLWAGLARAQDLAEIYTLYEERAIERLAQTLATLPENASQIPDIIFFRTIFNENGEEALAVFERLYQESDGWLRTVTAEKLAQYYYARGYYVKAAGYAEVAKTKPGSPPRGKIGMTSSEKDRRPVQQDEPLYAIQVGAFSYRDNAKKMLDLLSQHRLDAKIVNREINGKALFCVWISGTNDSDQTRKYAEEIKDKYNISYRIVKTQ